MNNTALNHDSLVKTMVSKKGESRAEAIIASATDLFLKHGYQDTSLGMIIEQSGGSRRHIYQHFENKEGLFAACMTNIMQSVLLQFDKLSLNSGDIEQDLIDVGNGFIRMLIQPKVARAFKIIIAEQNRFPNLCKEFYQVGPARAYSKMSEYLQVQQNKGLINIANPDITATQLIELLKGKIHLQVMLGIIDSIDEQEIDEYVREGVKLFFNGSLAK